MGLFDKIFRSTKPKSDQAKRYLSEAEIAQRNKEFMVRFDQAKNLFIASLEMQNVNSCQCAYPRFQQIIGIDCVETKNSFKCYDTDLLIDLSKMYFDIRESELKDENTNEKWV